MSKLNDLILQYCPDGVEYRPLEDVAIIKRGERVTKAQLLSNGQYPVISGGVKPLGFLDRYNRNENTITVAQYGTAGYVDWQKSKFWANDVCYSIFPSSIINNRYLYFVLLKNQKLLYSLKTNAIPSCLPVDKLVSIFIPVPPLPVQEEIVRILENFSLLSAELEAELEGRRKQYDFYRNRLLSFDANADSGSVQWKTLGEIEKKHCSGSTPSKSNSDYYENGTIPWLRTQDVRFNEIIEIDSFITEKALRETAVKWIPENCVIIAISGATAGRCAINKFRTTTNQHCLNIEIDADKALYKYVFYCVLNQYEELISLKQGARGDLNSTTILNLRIPIPSLSEQQRIVDILDRFDALTNDLTQGLPAEIEARKKQYEHYRDQLLTFKRKEA